MASNDHGQVGGQGLTEFVDRYKRYMQQKEETNEFIRVRPIDIEAFQTLS